jgi:hypothetical protein
MDPTKEKHQILCKSKKKSATETMAMIRQASRGKKPHELYMESQNSPTLKKARWEEHAHRFL